VTFRFLIGRSSWVAVGLGDDAVIDVMARNMDPTALRLAVINDLEPYLVDDGSPR
jgi:hypothetical protein